MREEKRKMMRNAWEASLKFLELTFYVYWEGLLLWRKQATEEWTNVCVGEVGLRNTNAVVQNRSCQRCSASSKQVTLYLWLHLGTRSVEPLDREPGRGKQMCLITRKIYIQAQLIQNHSLHPLERNPERFQSSKG